MPLVRTYSDCYANHNSNTTCSISQNDNLQSMSINYHVHVTCNNKQIVSDNNGLQCSQPLNKNTAMEGHWHRKHYVCLNKSIGPSDISAHHIHVNVQ